MRISNQHTETNRGRTNSICLRLQFFRGFEFLMNNSTASHGESCLSALTEAGTYGCPCGTSSFRINATLKTVAPNQPRYICTSSKQRSSEDILDIIGSDEFRQFLDRRTHFPDACKDADCGYLESCRGCAARTYLRRDLESKRPHRPADYLNQYDRPVLLTSLRRAVTASEARQLLMHLDCEAHPEFFGYPLPDDR